MNTVITRLVSVDCGECHVIFGIEENHYNDLVKYGKTFYCTNGHARAFRDNEVTRLRAEKLRLESRLEYVRSERDDARRETITQKQRASRFKNDRDKIKTRVANGVCPCCNRHFVALERHMKTKHPNYALNQPEL